MVKQREDLVNKMEKKVQDTRQKCDQHLADKEDVKNIL